MDTFLETPNASNAKIWSFMFLYASIDGIKFGRVVNRGAMSQKRIVKRAYEQSNLENILGQVVLLLLW